MTRTYRVEFESTSRRRFSSTPATGVSLYHVSHFHHKPGSTLGKHSNRVMPVRAHAYPCSTGTVEGVQIPLKTPSYSIPAPLEFQKGSLDSTDTRWVSGPSLPAPCPRDRALKTKKDKGCFPAFQLEDRVTDMASIVTHRRPLLPPCRYSLIPRTGFHT